MSFPKIEGYVVTEKLGSGSYSTVYKAYTKVGARTVVAIKCVDKSRIKNSGSAIDNLITEIRLLKTLTHPHIVHMKHFTWDDRNIYIITEYCCGGDLSKYIHRYGRVPEKQVLYFLQQLASALKFLREKGIVHMDLKPHNLLLHKGSDGKYILKVADFGFAQYMSEDTARCIRGSPLYMAPEMLKSAKGGDYDARVDLWSVGVIMYECLFGKAPYSSNTFKELIEKIQNHAPIEIPSRSSISSGCRDLLTSLLQHDPDKRISYEDFFRHEYLDLEHMPTKESYDKAVSLIKLAIELDCAGRAEEAFPCYCGALRRLVPAARAEPDADRSAALTAKITRYMERAEEIKQYLKETKTGDREPILPLPGQQSRASIATCCVTTKSNGHGNSYDFGQINKPCECQEANLNLGKCDSGGSGGTTAGSNKQSTQESQDISTSNGSKARQSSPGRFGLKRLFGRRLSIPYLESKDSSISAEIKGDDSKLPVGESGNEACRIT